MSTISQERAPAAVDPEVATVLLASIRPPASNVRKDFGDVEGLAEKIRKAGLLQALVVCPSDDGGWELLAGERRYRAATLAGCVTVPVTIRPRPSEQERIELQLIENLDRLDLASTEVYESVQQLLDLGATDADLAGTLGGSVEDAATLRGIVSLGGPVHELIADGALGLEDAAPLVQLASVDAHYVQAAADRIRHGAQPTEAVRQVLAMQRQDEIVREATAVAERRKLRLIDPPRFGQYEAGSSTQRLGKGLWNVDVPVKAHSTLECHAAFIDAYATSAKAALVLVCTNRKAHARPSTTTALSGSGTTTDRHQMTPAEKAVATKRHRKAWRETHAPRAAAIAKTVEALPLDDAMARVAAHVLQEGGFSGDVYLDAARHLVGSEAAPAQRSHAQRLVLTHAADGGEAAVRAAFAVLTARAEHAFQQPRGDHDERLNVRDHFQLLATHGYTVKDAEVDHLRDEYGVRDLAAQDTQIETFDEDDEGADDVGDPDPSSAEEVIEDDIDATSEVVA